MRVLFTGTFKEWHRNKFISRIQGWKEYLQFNRSLLPFAQELHRNEKFDLVHHVTYATWRVASPLWKLGIPFIFGPIGGNTNFPLRLLPILSPASASFELMRGISNATSRIAPGVRACLRRSTHVFAAEAETADLVQGIRGTAKGVSILSQAFFTPETIQAFSSPELLREKNGTLRIFAGGHLIGAKGVALALRALALAKTQGVKFKYRLGDVGGEVPHLRRLVEKFGLAEEVCFAPPLVGEQYKRELGASHIFLLPSLRDSAGLTLMESMLAGCVPIVADCGGPGRSVTQECGYKIAVSSAEKMTKQIAGAIIEMDREREIIFRKGAAATRRIATAYSEENYREQVNSVYAAAKKPA